MMKTNNLTLLLLLSIISLLAGCGGSSNPVKLEVTGSFAMTNFNFRGGFIIEGTGVTNPAYSFHVGLTNGDTVNLSLPDGTYNLKVVGWDDAAALPFTGLTKCASTTLTVNGPTTQEITVTAAGCLNNSLASAAYRNGLSFDSLVVQTCGSLESSTNPSQITSTNNASFNFCASFEPHLRNNLLGFKLIYTYDLNGTSAGSMTSACQSTNSSTQLRIPTTLPFKIEFYKGSTCTESVVKTLDFPNGFEGTASFDKNLATDSAYNYLVMAISEHGKGRGIFHTETPKLRCDWQGADKACGKVMSVTGGSPKYQMDAGPIWQRIRLPSGHTCLQSFSTPVGGVTYKSGSCRERNGSTYIMIRSSTAGTGSFNWGATVIPVAFSNPTTVYGGASNTNSRTRKLYQTIKSVIGYNDAATGDHIVALQDDYMDDGKNFSGVLGEVQQILSPYHAGGLFFTSTCSATALGAGNSITSNIFYHPNYWTSGENIQMVLSDPPAGLTIPQFLWNTSGPFANSAQAGLAYHRRILLRRFVGAPAVPETFATLDLACDSNTIVPRSITGITTDFRVGRFEKQITFADGTAGDTISKKELLHYNMSQLPYLRFEYYSQEDSKNSVSTLQNRKKSFYRVEKVSGNSDSSFRISAMTYEAERDGSSYDEFLNRFEIDGEYDPIDMTLTNSMAYTFKRLMELSKDNVSIENIFSEDIFPESKNNIFFDFNPRNSPLSKAATSSHVDGNYISIYPLSSGLGLTAFNGSLFTTSSYGITPLKIASATSPNGQYHIGVADDGTNISVYRFNALANTLTTISDTRPSAFPAKDLSVAVKDNGDYAIAAIMEEGGDDHFLYTAFNTFAGATLSWLDPFGGDSDRQVLNLAMTSSPTKIYLGVGTIQHLSPVTHLAWGEVDGSGFIYNTDFVDAALTYNDSNAARFKNLEAGYTSSNELLLSWTNINGVHYRFAATAADLTTKTVAAHTTTTHAPFGDYSYTVYYDIQLQINISSYLTYGHAYTPTVYAQPVMYSSPAKFQMKFSSLGEPGFAQVFSPATGPVGTTFGEAVGN